MLDTGFSLHTDFGQLCSPRSVVLDADSCSISGLLTGCLLTTGIGPFGSARKESCWGLVDPRTLGIAPMFRFDQDPLKVNGRKTQSCQKQLRSSINVRASTCNLLPLAKNPFVQQDSAAKVNVSVLSMRREASCQSSTDQDNSLPKCPCVQQNSQPKVAWLSSSVSSVHAQCAHTS